ncbi:MAG: type II secretion system protein [Planctomycetota bacterium]|jgi:prepilin-type N-terminal cleavage/methylation domain-containing protein
MDMKQKGFTLIEILVVVTIIGVLAGLVVVLIPRGQEKANIAECTNNQKQLAQTLISLDSTKFPDKYAGVNLLLYLFKAGHIDMAEENLQLLFCPGDGQDEGLQGSGHQPQRRVRHDELVCRSQPDGPRVQGDQVVHEAAGHDL